MRIYIIGDDGITLPREQPFAPIYIFLAGEGSPIDIAG
jgi:hypothetical protein